MRRDDLQAGYDGWQLIDCSINTGPVHGIGPVPVKALYETNNKTYTNNDTSRFLSMILSEVMLNLIIMLCNELIQVEIFLSLLAHKNF